MTRNAKMNIATIVGITGMGLMLLGLDKASWALAAPGIAAWFLGFVTAMSMDNNPPRTGT